MMEKQAKKTPQRGQRILSYLLRPDTDNIKGYFSGYMGGYSRGSRFTIKIMNHVLAFLLILLGLPVLGVIALIIKVREPGGPVLYKGERLGMGKRPFVMYKFRTLPVGAQVRLGPKVLAPRDYRLSFFSKFLRDTRLDELPQLFNILKGEMDFIGPRPLRPEIYERMCKGIRGYDIRFTVRPGLIGYSQLFTPHSSPKAIRALIDNRLVYLKRSFLIDLFFIFLTILIVVKKVVVLLGKAFWTYVIRIKVLRRFEEERRVLERRRVKGGVVEAYTLDDHEICEGVLGDMNEEYFRFETLERLVREGNGNQLYFDLQSGREVGEKEERRYLFKLRKRVKRMGRRKVKTGKCLGEVFRVWESQGKDGKTRYHYVIKYQPLNPFYQYCIDQYFLDKSVMHYF